MKLLQKNRHHVFRHSVYTDFQLLVLDRL